MKKNILKKTLSIMLAVMLTVSMLAVGMTSTSALTDENGCYVPGDNVTCGTNRYYFAMPKSWENEFSTDLGVYWFGNTDACWQIDGSTPTWPGYKANKTDFETNRYRLYYIDCPKDVEIIILNNYIDGGTDKTSPQYAAAKRSTDIYSGFIAIDEHPVYDTNFLSKMEESYKGDKSELGAYADNFYYDDKYDAGFVMNKNNMVYVIPNVPTGVNDVTGLPEYEGDWYFYYGDGKYGSYPTAEAAQKTGDYFSLDEANDLPGDVNGDGVVNVTDATDIMKANVGIITLTDEQTKLADLDGNGIINISDATIVMKMAVGLM